jgi:plasmid stabilization system protein ParE
MDYKLVITPLAQKDIEKAIEYYTEVSTNAPVNFLNAIENAYKTLEINPHFRILYKNYRALPLKKFPFILVFIINNENEVIVNACFHTSKSTKKYPK